MGYKKINPSPELRVPSPELGTAIPYPNIQMISQFLFANHANHSPLQFQFLTSYYLKGLIDFTPDPYSLI